MDLLTRPDLQKIGDELHKARHSANDLDVWSRKYGRRLIDTCLALMELRTDAPEDDCADLEALDTEVAETVCRMRRCDKFLCLPEGGCTCPIHGNQVEWPSKGIRWRPTVDQEAANFVFECLEGFGLRLAFLNRLPHWVEADLPEFCRAALDVARAALQESK